MLLFVGGHGDHFYLPALLLLRENNIVIDSKMASVQAGPAAAVLKEHVSRSAFDLNMIGLTDDVVVQSLVVKDAAKAAEEVAKADRAGATRRHCRGESSGCSARFGQSSSKNASISIAEEIPARTSAWRR